MPIPKKIHFCWLSGEPPSQQIKKCMNSWEEIMPDYEIICWNKDKFDITTVPFVNEAYSIGKWAFASDYIRLYALYQEGGIYLDSDVFVKKTFNQYLNHDFFTSIEYHPSIVKKEKTHLFLNQDGSSKYSSININGIGIQAAVLAGIKGHSFFKDCMNYYHDKRFILENGSLYDEIIAPAIYSMIAEKYGFKYIDKLQYLRENMVILPSKVFASSPDLASNESLAIHCCARSWKNPEKGIRKYILKLTKNNYIRRCFGKSPLNEEFQ